MRPPSGKIIAEFDDIFTEAHLITRDKDHFVSFLFVNFCFTDLYVLSLVMALVRDNFPFAFRVITLGLRYAPYYYFYFLKCHLQCTNSERNCARK